MYPDFNHGIILANTGNMKNMYDPHWNVSAFVSASYASPSGFVISALLDQARYYKDIQVNDKTIWACYTFGDKYHNASQPVVASGINYFSSSNIKPTVIPMSAEADPVFETSAHSYEFIERIAGFNRISMQQTHKSNLFSIRLKDTGINSLSADVKTKLQISINNLIENIIRKITPINTQLFKIYWVGK